MLCSDIDRDLEEWEFKVIFEWLLISFPIFFGIYSYKLLIFLYKKSTIKFDFTKEQTSKFKVPNYYKVQIAYVDEKGISSPFSDVGIIKYTSKPTVSIKVENNSSYGLTGIY